MTHKTGHAIHRLIYLHQTFAAAVWVISCCLLATIPTYTYGQDANLTRRTVDGGGKVYRWCLEGRVEERPDLYVDELHAKLKEFTEGPFSISTIRRALERMGITRKQVCLRSLFIIFCY